jgi:VWFA-related protein
MLLICVLIAQIARAGEIEGLAISQVNVQLPTIKVYLDAPDHEGQAVGGLTSQNLQASIGRQPLVVNAVTPFEASGEGVAYIVLIDSSRSLQDAQFAQMRLALGAWISDLRDADRMALLTFGEECKVLADFTADKAALQSMLDSIKPLERKTRLHEALQRAMELGRRGDTGLPHRRVIVVLSDGKDEGSGWAIEDVLENIRQTHIPIYAIGASGLAPGERQQYLDVLHRFAQSSGGIFREAGNTPLAEIYTTMKQSIQRVFVVNFTCGTCPADGQTQRLQINLQIGGRALSDGLEVRFIPNIAPPSSPLPQAMPVWWKRTPWWGWSLAGLSVLFVAASAFFIWRRRGRHGAADAEATRSADPLATIRESANGSRRGLQVNLTVLKGRESGRSYQLRLKDTAVVGRRQGCDLVLGEDEQISGRHCEFELVDGWVMVGDLQSTNGTSVNSVPVNGRCRLENGDTMLIGKTEFRVTFERQ